MLIIIGLIILVTALVVGVAGVLSNGNTHQVGHEFSVLGYHVTGSSGTLFLVGIVVGAAGLLGLSLLLAGARRTSRRGTAARRSLRQSRRDTAAVSKDRDDLIEQRDTALATSASIPSEVPPQDADHRHAADGQRGGFHLFGRQFGPWQTTTAQPDPAVGQPADGVLADPAASDLPPDSSVLIPARAPASDAATSGSDQENNASAVAAGPGNEPVTTSEIG